MQVINKPFQEVPQFSSKDIAYATGANHLKPFFKYEVTLSAFAKVMEDKKLSSAQRNVLADALSEQYQGLETTAQVSANIEALRKDQTFTIITAHQPALFTGPLYYIYKIISAIRLTQELKAAYPNNEFVPVFISGAEDHDFEEINHTQLFGKQIVWKNDEQGACGQMKTGSLSDALATLKEILGSSESAQATFQMIEAAYTSHDRYGDATQDLVNRLFKDYGLLVANMNHAALKKQFIPYVEKEIFESFSNPLVQKTQEALEAVDFGAQAHARDINLFYLRDQIRARIEKEGDEFVIVGTSYRFSAEALKAELYNHPERFSPNVVMRPIYQEITFPNLAYIGGGGELAYWLERKAQFEAFGVNFPMLIRRNSAMWVDKGSRKKIEKLGLEIDDLFQDTEALLQHFVKANTENEINLKAEKEALEAILLGVSQKAKEVDPSLEKKVLAENAKILNSIAALESRLMRAEKQRFETSLNQIKGLRDKFFPNNGLQERHDNFLAHYIKYGHDWFEMLLEELNPLQEGMVIFVED